MADGRRHSLVRVVRVSLNLILNSTEANEADRAGLIKLDEKICTESCEPDNFGCTEAC